MALFSIKLSPKNSSGNFVFENKVLVKPKDIVEKGQLLARVIKSEIVQIELCRELGVKIKDVAKYLLKKKGDKVEAGEAIAKYKSLFSTKILKSPVLGEVIHFNPE